jgi:hypothetical protein
MRQKSYPNPDWQARYCPWRQKAFIEQAREWYRTKSHRLPAGTVTHYIPQELSWWDRCQISRGHKAPLPPKPLYYNIELIQWLYKLGRDLNEIFLPLDLFARAVSDWPAYYLDWDIGRRPSYSFRYYNRWRDYLPYRKGHHHAHVPKKVRNEKFLQKQEWRERKGFSRDQKQRGYHRQCSAKTWAKKMSNRSERRHVRQCLHNEKEMLPHRWFKDSWMWD